MSGPSSAFQSEPGTGIRRSKSNESSEASIFEPKYDSSDECQIEGEIDVCGKYEFSPFNPEVPNQIRLLVIHPGRFEDRIHCSLVRTNLDDAPLFEAISYTWADENGDSTVCREIAVRTGGVIPV